MRRFWIVMGILWAIWLSGFLIFIYGIPKKPADYITKTDAIVVWTGGPCRITTGVELLEQGLSDKLFVSGVEKAKPQLLSKKCNSYLSAETVTQLNPKIFFGYSALSTHGNALETSLWVHKNNVKSVRLVTTAVHMPRSLIEFHMAMPEITVIPHPVNIKKFDHRHWHQNSLTFYKVVREYCKFLIVKTGISPWWRDNILDES